MAGRPPLNPLPRSMTTWTTRGDGLDRLRSQVVDLPALPERHVLVRMSAVALNYRDLLVVDGHPGWKPDQPVVPVSDGVGHVVARGGGAARFDLGDRVSAAFLPHWRSGPLTRTTYTAPVGGPVNRGMLSEYVVLHEDEAVAAPAHLSDHEAATLPVAGVTAWHAVARRCRVAPGDTVLVHGTGGVALFALQLCVALGAEVVITSSSDAKLEQARLLGARWTVNYRTTPDVAAAVLAATGEEGVDHVVETVGGTNLDTSLRAVRIGGTIAFIGLLAGLSAQVSTYQFVTRNVTLHGIETGSVEMLEELGRFLEQHEIRPVVDSVFPVSDLTPALQHLARGGHFGKVVVDLRP